jgi:hypothetical protein
VSPVRMPNQEFPVYLHLSSVSLIWAVVRLADRVVAFDTREPRFEPRHQIDFINLFLTLSCFLF